MKVAQAIVPVSAMAAAMVTMLRFLLGSVVSMVYSSLKNPLTECPPDMSLTFSVCPVQRFAG
jgi:hypothetical protein